MILTKVQNFFWILSTRRMKSLSTRSCCGSQGSISSTTRPKMSCSSNVNASLWSRINDSSHQSKNFAPLHSPASVIHITSWPAQSGLSLILCKLRQHYYLLTSSKHHPPNVLASSTFLVTTRFTMLKFHPVSTGGIWSLLTSWACRLSGVSVQINGWHIVLMVWKKERPSQGNEGCLNGW